MNFAATDWRWGEPPALTAEPDSGAGAVVEESGATPSPVGPPGGESRAGEDGTVRRSVVDADCEVATDGPEGVDCPVLREGFRGGAGREGRLAVGGCTASPESSPSTMASETLSRFDPVAGSLAGLSSGKQSPMSDDGQNSAVSVVIHLTP